MKIKEYISFRDNPLKIRSFRFFILGHFISFTGTWIQNTAQTWLVYELTKSSYYLGLFNLISSSPIIFFSFLSGLIIDFFDRKKLLITILLLAIFPSLILGILTQTGKITFWIITFLSLFSTCLSGIDVPLRQVFISEIVPTEYIVKAISFQSLSFNTARMIGPFIAGLIISYMNLYECFYINALSFVPFLIFLIFWIRPLSNSSSISKKKMEIKRSYKELFHFLKKKKNILSVILTVCIFTFFGASVLVILPVIVYKFYGGGGKEFGFLSSMIGMGAILGATSVIFRKAVEDKLFNILLATILLSISILGLGWITKWIFTTIFCIFIGFSFTNFFPVANGYIQENTPSELRGRVMSLFTLSFLGVYPIGNFFIGLLAEKFNLRLLLTIYTILLISLNFSLIKFAKNESLKIKN